MRVGERGQSVISNPMGVFWYWNSHGWPKVTPIILPIHAPCTLSRYVSQVNSSIGVAFWAWEQGVAVVAISSKSSGTSGLIGSPAKVAFVIRREPTIVPQRARQG